MKAAVLLLALVAGCTHATSDATPSPTASPSATRTANSACGGPEHPKANLLRLDARTGQVVARRALPPRRQITRHGNQLYISSGGAALDGPLTSIDASPPAQPVPGSEIVRQGGAKVRHLLTYGGVSVVLGPEGMQGEDLKEHRRVLWNVRSLHGYESDVAAADARRIYAAGTLVTTHDGTQRVYAVDPHEGDVKWAQPTEERVNVRDLIVVGGLVIVSESAEGRGPVAHIAAFDKRNGHPVWSTALSTGQVTSLDTYRGQLVVTEQDTEIFCD